jgi:hypothetical protein
MTADQRRICDGLDDASITETMEWLRDQCLLLQFQLEQSADILTDIRGAERLPKSGGGEE